VNKTATCENAINTPVLLIGRVKGEMKGGFWPRLLWRMGQCSADDGHAAETDAYIWVCRCKVRSYDNTPQNGTMPFSHYFPIPSGLLGLPILHPVIPPIIPSSHDLVDLFSCPVMQSSHHLGWRGKSNGTTILSGYIVILVPSFVLLFIPSVNSLIPPVSCPVLSCCHLDRTSK